MLVKAFVVKQSTIPGEENKYLIRIPIIHGTPGTPQCVPDDLLPRAPICSLPGFTNIVQPGDVVYIGFENEEYSNPVILGQLLTNLDPASINQQNNTVTRANAILQTLSFFDNHEGDYTSAQLPTKTNIGKVKAQEIAYLVGLKDNIQEQIDKLNSEIGEVSSQIDRINGEVI